MTNNPGGLSFAITFCTALIANIPGGLSFSITFCTALIANIPGGSISPLLFCTALIALTHELNRADCGYQVDKTVKKVSNVLYINDLKMLFRYEDEMRIK